MMHGEKKMTGSLEHRKLFVALYETFWAGQWSGRKSDDHARQWWKLVDKLSETEIRAIISSAQNLKPTGFGPTIPVFWKLYQKETSTQRREFNHQDCIYCENSGYIVVPAIMSEGKWLIGEIDKGILALIGFPCICSWGRIYRGDRRPSEAEWKAYDYNQRSLEQIPLILFKAKTINGKIQELRKREDYNTRSFSLSRLYQVTIEDSRQMYYDKRQQEKMF